MQRESYSAGARRASGETSGAAARRQWDRLTEADLKGAAGDRAALARKIAQAYGVSVRRAKREVRDFGRVMRVARGGRASGGKRNRKAYSRAAGAIAATVDEIRRRLGRVLSTGGLAGESGATEPLPSGLVATDAEPFPEPASPEPHPVDDAGQGVGGAHGGREDDLSYIESSLPGESGSVEPMPGDDNEVAH